MKKKNKKISRPTMADMKNEINSFKKLLNIFKIFKITKMGTFNISDIENKLQYMQKTFKRLNEIPESFNNFFVNRGWVAYGSLNIDLMEECVKLAKSGKYDEAENTLFEYYSYEIIKDELWRLIFKLEVVKIREELLNLCLEDFLQKRYHACIPILLSIIDGIVCDISPQQKSGAGVEIDAWNSITCIDNGINILYKEIIHKTRRKTTTEKITLPYRNGILHGRDLGYANNEVAVKCWHLFFAICSWVEELKSEKQRKEEYLKKHENDDKSLLEVFKDLTELQKDKEEFEKTLQEWKPRQIDNSKFPLDIFSIEFDKNSPEEAFKNILIAWKNKQYGLIAKSILNVKPTEIKRKAGELKQELEDKKFLNAEILEIKDNAISLTEVTINIECKIYGNQKRFDNYKIRLICQDTNGNPTMRNCKNSDITWRIIPAVFYMLT